MGPPNDLHDNMERSSYAIGQSADVTQTWLEDQFDLYNQALTFCFGVCDVIISTAHQ